MRTLAFLALLAACGGSSGVPDGGTPDAAPETGTVTVDGPTARSDTPITVTLIVNDASGAFISRTGPQGSNARFAVEVPPGGMVSIISNDPAYSEETQILTWTGVQQGDHLVHYDRREPTATYPVEYTVAPVAGATQYCFSTRCPGYDLHVGGSFGAGLRSYELNCFPDPAPTVSVLVTAETPAGWRFASATQVPLAASGTTMVPLSAYQDPAGSVSVTVTRAGGYADSTMSFLVRLAPGHEVAGGYVYGTEGSTIALGPMDVPDFPGRLSISLRGPSVATNLSREYATFPAALELDVLSDFLVPFSGMLSADAATITVFAPAGVEPDLLVVFLELSDETLGDMQWILLAPGSSRSLAVPDLQLGVDPAISRMHAYDYEAVDGYDGARLMTRELFGGLAIGGDRRSSSTFFYQGTR